MSVAASSKAVRLDSVSVSYGDTVAVRDVSLEVAAGEVLALLGPSGCGKSTLLRSVAGFVPHSGKIFIGGTALSRVPPHRRDIGMVFQDYALFPHMTVSQNVGFGLRMRRVARPEARARVQEALALVGLQGFDDRMARQLSGGQQQRVALARALVIRPAVLLLDEPLSALDKKLREEMRGELKRIQNLTGVTTIFVTHDQDEALALSDRLALMFRGSLLQFGAPEDVYRRPLSRVAAEFLGAANCKAAICREVGADDVLLDVPGAGSVRAARRQAAFAVGQHVTMYVRPEQIRLSAASREPQAAGLAATITARSYLGRHVELVARVDSGAEWIVHAVDDDAQAALAVGDRVRLSPDPRQIIIFDGPAPDR